MTLTKRLLGAMEEALCFRLAGPIEDTENAPRDYDEALGWVTGQISKRARRAQARAAARAALARFRGGVSG